MSKPRLSLTHTSVLTDIPEMARCLRSLFWIGQAGLNVYPVPRGGVPVAYLLLTQMRLQFALRPELADVILDDIIETGRTRDQFPEEIPFVALYHKDVGRAPKKGNWYTIHTVDPDKWIVFPWERVDEPVNR